MPAQLGASIMRAQLRILATAALTISFSTVATAAEIKLMCPAPMRTTIVDLVAQFERTSLHKVAVVHTPSRMIVERIQAGEAFDILRRVSQRLNLRLHEVAARLAETGEAPQ